MNVLRVPIILSSYTRGIQSIITHSSRYLHRLTIGYIVKEKGRRITPTTDRDIPISLSVKPNPPINKNQNFYFHAETKKCKSIVIILVTEFSENY